jgi:hypothetical protein
MYYCKLCLQVRPIYKRDCLLQRCFPFDRDFDATALLLNIGCPTSDSCPRHCRLGSGFADVFTQQIFSPAMDAIITELMIWIDVAQYNWLCETAIKADAEWMCRKGQAILHCLLLILAISPRDINVLPLHRKEECCRFVLIILLSYVSMQMEWRSGKMNMARS